MKVLVGWIFRDKGSEGTERVRLRGVAESIGETPLVLSASTAETGVVKLAENRPKIEKIVVMTTIFATFEDFSPLLSPKNRQNAV